ncbi:MAG: hypothetical protein ABI868_13155 [Acidobacteriota bacterium]
MIIVAGVQAPRFRPLRYLAAGAAGPAVAVAAFKLGLSPSNDLFTQQTAADIAGKLIDPGRWTTVIDRFVDLVPAWGEVPGGALAGLGLAVVLAASPDRRSARRAGFAMLLVGAMLTGYGLIYVITPAPLEWQIATSLDRLLTQLWPTTVWAAFQLSGGGPGLSADVSSGAT